ncbi:MAG TPA: hypothetical protein VMN36_17910 [Verrucomicrobiales bacterium]|nr:hypothetical protein [Verrucomicrobiales bacterium]
MFEVYTPIEGHKPRLSSRFSWPIGVEALSNYLADVPQADDLRVWFNDRPMEYRWTMDKIADQKLAYQIATVWYAATGREPRWFLMIYPVESGLRRQAKELLEAEGLQHIRTFLTREHTETELLTSHHFRCIFDPVNKTLSYKNDKG